MPLIGTILKSYTVPNTSHIIVVYKERNFIQRIKYHSRLKANSPGVFGISMDALISVAREHLFIFVQGNFCRREHS